jgi:cell fate (sporulation/competence/biofilm development) regulator YlbF (YheA/YmcA/DUF963 family)
LEGDVIGKKKARQLVRMANPTRHWNQALCDPQNIARPTRQQKRRTAFIAAKQNIANKYRVGEYSYDTTFQRRIRRAVIRDMAAGRTA